MARVSFLGGIVTTWALTACFASHPGDPFAVGPTGPCAPAAAPYEAPRCRGPGRCVDILFVVDNRESMLEEQVSLFEQVPLLTRTLTTGDQNGDGIEDFPPVTDLHFAAITADLGSGGTFVDGCLSPDFGDDAILGRGRTGRLSDVCGLDVPSFLAFAPDIDLERFELDAACSVAMGIFGCPYAQPLEAALKALSESRDRPRFFGGTCGHADGGNRAFLREDSILAVFIVSDHDDCSVADASLFVEAAEREAEDPGVICDEASDRLHDPGRFVMGISGLRDDPADLVFAPIVGVPPDAVPETGAPDFDAILARSDMQVRRDPRDDSRLAPSCNVAGRGLSFPPRRYVEVAQGLDASGATVAITSICEAGGSRAIDAIVGRL